MPEDHAQQLIQAVQKVRHSLTNRVNSFTPARLLIVSVVAACLIAVAFHYVFPSNRALREITFLSGPAGSHGYNLADRLAQALDAPDQHEWRQPRLQLVTQPTNGYEENRKLVHDDYRGNRIGFAHDGFNASDKVNVLLPLEYSYLHVIVSHELYNAAMPGNSPRSSEQATGKPQPSGEPPTSGEPQPSRSSSRTFADIRNLLKNPKSEGFGKFVRNKVALGASSSGTRQLTDIVMEHYGIPTAQLDIGRKYDWTETIAAMHRQEIHLAFFLAEPGLPLFHKLAASGEFYLLGFDDALGISATRPYIHSVKIPRHTYGHPSSDGDRVCFCSSEIMTLATRRVIIAGSTMPTDTAFHLARHLSAAYGSMVRPVSWKLRTPTLETTEGDIRDGTLYYAIHPGAKYVEQNRQPWYQMIPQPVQTWGISILLVLAFTSTIRALSYTSEWVAGPSNPGSRADSDTLTAPERLAATAEAAEVAPLPTAPLNGAPLGQWQDPSPLTASETQPLVTADVLAPLAAATYVPHSSIPCEEPAVPAVKAPADQLFMGLLDEILERLHQVPAELPPGPLRSWQRKYRALRVRCVDVANQHSFNDQQRVELIAALGKLDWAIASAGMSPNPSPAAG